MGKVLLKKLKMSRLNIMLEDKNNEQEGNIKLASRSDPNSTSTSGTGQSMVDHK